MFELWCNGNTADFGSVVLGSNPGSSTTAAAIDAVAKAVRLNKSGCDKCVYADYHIRFYCISEGVLAQGYCATGRNGACYAEGVRRNKNQLSAYLAVRDECRDPQQYDRADDGRGQAGQRAHGHPSEK